MGASGRRLVNEAFRGVLTGVAKQTRSHGSPPLAFSLLGRNSVDSFGAASFCACRKYVGAASAGPQREYPCESATSGIWKMSGRSSHAGERMAVVALLSGGIRRAGIHGGGAVEMAASGEPKTYGVGPTMGADRDPQSKGSTPDDFRADDVHMAEPKEITKEKAAAAQQEPPDFQVQKIMAEREEPIGHGAEAQRDPREQVFDPATRRTEGTAEKQGDTTGLETDKLDAQYGTSIPAKDETSQGTSRS